MSFIGKILKKFLNKKTNYKNNTQILMYDVSNVLVPSFEELSDLDKDKVMEYKDGR